MSKTLFTFLLSEITCLRVHCPHCKGVAELTVVRLGLDQAARCKLCSRDFGGEALANAIAAFARSLEALQKAEVDVKIEVPIEDRQP